MLARRFGGLRHLYGWDQIRPVAMKSGCLLHDWLSRTIYSPGHLYACDRALQVMSFGGRFALGLWLRFRRICQWKAVLYR